ncbi:MAG: hypothetical protein HY275_10040 [Gemmatimonadetes bacterium]|nr:hypothetical protein [Gemmatimonadota bacterium]
MRSLLMLLLALGDVGSPPAQAVRATAMTSPSRADRLATLGRVWSAAAYFHPFLAHRDLDWDAAFVAAYRRMHGALTTDEFAQVVERMLATLGDPATRVSRARAPDAGVRPTGALVRWIGDSTLVIRFSAIGDLVDFPRIAARLDTLARLVDVSRSVILDLRDTGGNGASDGGLDLAGWFHFGYFRAPFDSHLLAAPLVSTPHRSRMHVGLADQWRGLTDYYSAFRTPDPVSFAPAAGAHARPIAVIVDEASVVPEIVVTLRAAGLLDVVAVGASPVLPCAVHEIALGDGYRARLRTSEPLDGTVALPVDTLLGDGAGDATVLDAALRLIRMPSRSRAEGLERADMTTGVRPPDTRASDTPTLPDSAHRVLAALRLWSATRYLFPFRDIAGASWDHLMPAWIARMEASGDSVAYALGVVAMVRDLHDSHGLVISPVLRAHSGGALAPVRVRLLEGRPIITAFLDSVPQARNALAIGDEILEVDGRPARDVLARSDVPQGFSTPQSEREARARFLLRGAEGTSVSLRVRGADGRARTARVDRIAEAALQWERERAGPMIRRLAGGIGYADLTRLAVSEVDSMFALLAGAPAIIFDMRGYPRGTALAIAPRLAREPAQVAALLRVPVAASPDADETGDQVVRQRIPSTDRPHFAGRTLLLIDERAQSQAEHSGLFLEAANGTRFVGSPTSGADGGITYVVLPGGVVVRITGEEVRHADGRPLQRVGLVPDLAVQPTIAGVRAGRDEVLDAAVALLLRDAAARGHSRGPPSRGTPSR